MEQEVAIHAFSIWTKSKLLAGGCVCVSNQLLPVKLLGKKRWSYELEGRLSPFFFCLQDVGRTPVVGRQLFTKVTH